MPSTSHPPIRTYVYEKHEPYHKRYQIATTIQRLFCTDHKQVAQSWANLGLDVYDFTSKKFLTNDESHS